MRVDIRSTDYMGPARLTCKKNISFSNVYQTLLAAAFSLAACVAGNAQEAIIAQDNFNYSNGSSLAGLDGGTGWTGSWVNDYLSGDSLTVDSSGLTYPGLTSGGSATWSGASGNGISEDSRYLPLQDSGLVYIQFLCQFGTQSGGGTPNLRFSDSLANLVFGIGANGGTYGQNISLLVPNLNAAANGSQTATNSSLSSLNLVVAQVDYNDDTISMWVDPDLTNFDYIAPPAADAVVTLDSAPDFNNVAIDARQGSISDLEIMTTPEPTTVSLFCTGLAVLAWRRRYVKITGSVAGKNGRGNWPIAGR
jgi:PEP-CTERM motif